MGRAWKKARAVNFARASIVSFCAWFDTRLLVTADLLQDHANGNTVIV